MNKMFRKPNEDPDNSLEVVIIKEE